MTTIPTYARRLDASIDPLMAFRRLTNDGEVDGCVLFETADQALGGRSLLLTRPALALRVDQAGAHIEPCCTIDSAVLDALGPLHAAFDNVERTAEARLDAPAFDALRRFATTFLPSRTDLDLFCLGAFSFDLIDHVERLGELRRDTDDMVFYLPAELVVIDHDRHTTTVIEFDFSGRGEFACGERIADVCRELGELEPAGGVQLCAAPIDVEVDRSDVEFGGLVEQARRHIVDGEVFQVVLSRTFTTPCPEPIAAYRALRTQNPSPYMFYFGGPDVLFGASPETSLRVIGDEVEIRPIAGTRRRGVTGDGTIDADLDTRIEAELRLDHKEVAEHMMLVDLARNDVARVSKTGTRRVDRLLGVDRYSTVMHLVSHVAGTLRPELDALHAYAAAMNMGTLTGAPKVRATELLRELEGSARGFYGGAVGYITHRGDMDTAIVIRSATVRDEIATVRAGAGIVHDSDPASEADETRRKANSVLRAIAATHHQETA